MFQRVPQDPNQPHSHNLNWLLESPSLNTHGGNVYLAFVVFQRKLNLDIEFSNKLQQLTFSGPNYLIQNTSGQRVLNKRETTEKFAISRSTASLITAESENCLSLREANTVSFSTALLRKRMPGKPSQLPEGSLWGHIKPLAWNQSPHQWHGSQAEHRKKHPGILGFC